MEERAAHDNTISAVAAEVSRLKFGQAELVKAHRQYQVSTLLFNLRCLGGCPQCPAPSLLGSLLHGGQCHLGRAELVTTMSGWGTGRLGRVR
jgi:hypothetical protein